VYLRSPGLDADWLGGTDVLALGRVVDGVCDVGEGPEELLHPATATATARPVRQGPVSVRTHFPPSPGRRPGCVKPRYTSSEKRVLPDR